MKNISDERLDELLTEYCETAPEQSFVFDPYRKKEKLIPLARYRRLAAAAASVMLVSVLSITIYFLFGNKASTPIAVAPSSGSVITPSSPPDGSGGGIPYDPDGTTAPAQLGTAPAQSPDSIFYRPSEMTGDTSPTGPSPSEKVSGNGTAASNETTSPTQPKPTEKADDPPYVRPTQAYEEPTRAPMSPTEPVDPPWNEDPTEENPDPWLPPEPTEDSSGDEPGLPPSNVIFYGRIDSVLLGERDKVYCKIYDLSGHMLGEKDLYSESHFAEIRSRSGGVTLVSYTTPDGLIYSPGYYNYVFYNDRGKLLTQGQTFVDY